MTMKQNEIYLQKHRKVIVNAGLGKLDDAMVATVMRNIESLGFVFSEPLFMRLKTLSLDQLENFYLEIVPYLKKMVGAHVRHRPMYPNFPKQVLEMSECELYMNAMVHYWSAFLQDVGVIENTVLPEYEVKERAPLLEKHPLKMIGLGDTKDFYNIFTQLAASKSSISEYDKSVLAWFIETYPETIVGFLPDAIPFKEQLCYLAALFIKAGNADVLTKYIKTATDVLRIATGLSGGDISLSKTGKFKKWTRGERKFLLRLLEECNSNIAEDMLKHKNIWIRLLHGLHAGDYKGNFPKVFKAATILRDDIKIKTFNNQVETLVLSDPAAAAALLEQRPGEFARRLDKLIRDSNGQAGFVQDHFNKVIDKVSTPVLLQLLHHFQYRDQYGEVRSFFPKGQTAKVKVIGNTLPDIDPVILAQITANITIVLKQRFAGLTPLGKTYIDPALKTYLLPMAQRSASKQLKTIARGSRVKIKGSDATLRFFIWWKNGTERTDLDLSCQFLADDFTASGTIAYYNLRNTGLGWHSGDITDAPKGASEFIDIHMPTAMKNARYVVMVVNSFTSQPYKDLPECFAGWMIRQRPNSGEIYEPKTVQNKFDLTADSKIAVPVIFDLKTKEAIWVDLSLKNNPSFSNNVYRNSNSLTKVCHALATLNRPTLYDLLELHVLGRGELVTKKEKAKTIFDESFATETDTILSAYL